MTNSPFTNSSRESAALQLATTVPPRHSERSLRSEESLFSRLSSKPLLLALLLSLAFLPIVAMNLSAQSDRAKQVGMKLKCMCKGCDMTAGGCSHPGGAFSGPCETAKGMLKDVDLRLAKGETDEQIIQDFVNQYGAIVYVEPPKHGFGLVAWVMPFFYAILGIALVIVVIRKWLTPRPAASSASSTSAVSHEALDRLRAQASRETED